MELHYNLDTIRERLAMRKLIIVLAMVSGLLCLATCRKDNQNIVKEPNQTSAPVRKGN